MVMEVGDDESEREDDEDEEGDEDASDGEEEDILLGSVPYGMFGLRDSFLESSAYVEMWDADVLGLGDSDWDEGGGTNDVAPCFEEYKRLAGMPRWDYHDYAFRCSLDRRKVARKAWEGNNPKALSHKPNAGRQAYIAMRCSSTCLIGVFSGQSGKSLLRVWKYAESADIGAPHMIPSSYCCCLHVTALEITVWVRADNTEPIKKKKRKANVKPGRILRKAFRVFTGSVIPHVEKEYLVEMLIDHWIAKEITWRVNGKELCRAAIPPSCFFLGYSTPGRDGSIEILTPDNAKKV